MKTILIVDDEPAARYGLRRALESKYRVAEADSADSAVGKTACHSVPYDPWDGWENRPCFQPPNSFQGDESHDSFVRRLSAAGLARVAGGLSAAAAR